MGVTFMLAVLCLACACFLGLVFCSASITTTRLTRRPGLFVEKKKGEPTKKNGITTSPSARVPAARRDDDPRLSNTHKIPSVTSVYTSVYRLASIPIGVRQDRRCLETVRRCRHIFFFHSAFMRDSPYLCWAVRICASMRLCRHVREQPSTPLWPVFFFLAAVRGRQFYLRLSTYGSAR
ncbi:hypothetical protein C8R43DRAFT_67905 [Mycena crocata]|nr:hypothetical protein C8R43DRAFT_67905 [Mycena crocata]